MEARAPLAAVEPPGDIDGEVSARIRSILAYRQLEQKDLAAASGVPEPTLSRKLRGVAGPWRLAELARISGALGLQLGKLIDPTAPTT